MNGCSIGDAAGKNILMAAAEDRRDIGLAPSKDAFYAAAIDRREVGSAINITTNSPPLLIVVWSTVPPIKKTFTMPLLLIVVTSALPPASTISSPPLLTVVRVGVAGSMDIFYAAAKGRLVGETASVDIRCGAAGNSCVSSGAASVDS